jgi:hypothetical protein
MLVKKIQWEYYVGTLSTKSKIAAYKIGCNSNWTIFYKITNAFAITTCINTNKIQIAKWHITPLYKLSFKTFKYTEYEISPSTEEMEAGRLQVWRQPGLYSKALTQKFMLCYFNNYTNI